jgi:hypothetical protein
MKMKTMKKGIRVMLFDSQHFGGKRGMLELWDGD